MSTDPTPAEPSGYTSHGHPYGPNPPAERPPGAARCGGPPMCRTCRREVEGAAEKAARVQHLVDMFAPTPAEPDEGYDEFTVDEHLTEPVTYVKPSRVVAEPVVSVPDTDVYLDAATAFKDAECAGVPGSDPAEQWMLDYAQRISERGPFRAAADRVWHAARAPLLAELAEARATAERLRTHFNLAYDELGEMMRQRDALQRSLAQVDAALAEAGIGCRSRADGVADLAAMADGSREELAAVEHERDEARAAALPEGGRWVTEYLVVGADGTVQFVAGCDHVHLYPGERMTTRRAWYGPPEPVTETEAHGG